MKNIKKTTTALIAAFAIGGTLVLSSCTAISVKSDLVLNENGTGSRTITGVIAKGDDNGDGYGQSYYYLKKHGEALEKYIETVYSTKIPDSATWLNVEVDNTSSDKETIELSFEFTTFTDYTSKLGSLVKFGVEDAAYTAPTLTTNSDESITYTESQTVSKSIYTALQQYIMNDEEVFDFNCTVDGSATNTSASLDDLISNGVELDKTASMSIKIGVNAAEVVAVTDGKYTLTAKWSGKVEHQTTCILDYSFNDVLTNAGTLGVNGDLTKGTGSSSNSGFVDGIDGKGYYFDGTSYLASPNRSFTYDEMTISFYYKMEEYFETDTKANMVIVPAGLGALSGGVIDLEFIQEGDATGVQLLAKTNSSNWMVQDKLYSTETIKLNEWHCYTIVYQNEYDADGQIENAYISLYIDGERAERMELSQAAGLKYSLGVEDDGSLGGTLNGGFNVGGYYENETVKRGCKGILDNLKVFDGSLSAAEVKSLCYTVKVNNEGNDNNSSNGSSSGDDKTSSSKKGCGSVVFADAAVILTVLGAGAVVLRKRK